MVGFVRGKLIAKHEEGNQCVLLAGDIGYELTLTKRLFETIVVGETLSLWVHTHVREDILMLYGFATEQEKQFFRVLLGVSGLGPRITLSLLSEHGAERLSQHIVSKDIDAISEAPGVGKKLAQRLCLELGAKVEKLTWVAQLQQISAVNRAVAAPAERRLRDDLQSALLNLGYAPNQVKNVLDKILAREEEEELGFEPCLRSALKELSGRPSALSGEAGRA